MQQFSDGDEYQQSLAKMVIYRFNPAMHDVKEFLPVMYEKAIHWDVKDKKDDRLQILLLKLGEIDPKGEYMFRFLREAVKAGQSERFEAAFTNFFDQVDNLSNRQSWRRNMGFYPFLFEQESPSSAEMRMPWNADADSEEKKCEFTPFGKELLSFLREEGLKSENKEIRETSQKAIETMTKIAESDPKKYSSLSRDRRVISSSQKVLFRHLVVGDNSGSPGA